MEEKAEGLIDTSSGSDKHTAAVKAARKKLIKTAVKCLIVLVAVLYISSIFANFEQLVGTGATTSLHYGNYYITHYMSKTDEIDLFVDFSVQRLADTAVILKIYINESNFEDKNTHYDIENLTATVRIVGKYECHYSDAMYSSGGEKYDIMRPSTYETLGVTGIYGWGDEYICECPKAYCNIILPISDIDGELDIHLLLNYDIVGNGLYAWNVFREQNQEIVYTIASPEE